MSVMFLTGAVMFVGALGGMFKLYTDGVMAREKERIAKLPMVEILYPDHPVNQEEGVDFEER